LVAAAAPEEIIIIHRARVVTVHQSRLSFLSRRTRGFQFGSVVVAAVAVVAFVVMGLGGLQVQSQLTKQLLQSLEAGAVADLH